MNSKQDLQRRANDYAQKHDVKLMQSAGSGVNGAVWYTNRGSVIKRMLAALRGMGIYYVDINRGNIRFPEFDEEIADDG